MGLWQMAHRSYGLMGPLLRPLSHGERGREMDETASRPAVYDS